MTHLDVDAAGNVIEGKLLICDYKVRVLFDLGSTLSYITPHFTSVIGKKLMHLQFVLTITTRVGKKVV